MNTMGIFSRTKKAEAKTAQAAAKNTAKTASVRKEAASSDVQQGSSGMRSTRALRSPRVTEKSAVLASKGRYVFNVPVSANKTEIRKAVEALYKVNVVAVRTVRGEGKIVRRGRIQGQRSAWKKAIVSLKSGQTIDLYKGV